jgi:hypothetical protein
LQDGFNRWGWTIGPLKPNKYYFPVYAGAGQCETGNGKLVGQLIFEYTGEIARATYNWYSGYKMTETHFYIGGSPYPIFKDKKTVAPGKYTAIHTECGNEGKQDVFNFDRIPSKTDQGEVYIIAHAVSCGASKRRHLTESGCTCICPTDSPTSSPTFLPTPFPTSSPTAGPTAGPTKSPTAGPTKSPTDSPTGAPSKAYLAPPEDKTIDYPPVSLPQKCVGYSASWSGDPHMTTFDGLKYDCQGEGEFHVLKSLNSTFELQARFVKFREGSRPTVTKSVVFNTGDGEPSIQVEVPSSGSNGCVPYVYVNGVKRDVEKSGVGTSAVQIQAVHTSNEDGYIIYYHGSKVQLTTMAKKSSANGCVLATKLCLPFDYERTEETFVGLLGTPNDDKSDDWMTKKGGNIKIPTNKNDLRFGPAYNFCVDNWCVNAREKSMFTYDAGDSFEKYFKCGQPADTNTESCATNPPAVLQRICGSQNPACMIDGCVGGPEEAKKYVESEASLVDKMCGKQVFFEDFNKGMDGPWGKMYSKNDFTFLHLYKGSNKVGTKKDVPKFAEFIVVEFLFYELGGWEYEGNAKDYVYVTVNGQKVDLQTFGNDDKLDDFRHDIEHGISWIRKSICESGDMGLGSKTDQMHKVTLKVPQELFSSGVLDFQLEVIMSGDKENESAGFDDFRITAYGKSCVIPEPDPALAPPKQLPPVPEVLPVVCEENAAILWGDPHITTFDGLKYDCQGEGEFTVIKSLNEKKESKFEMQGRFFRFSTRRDQTVTRAISIKEEGVPTIQLNVPKVYDSKCALTLFVGGQQRNLMEGTNVDSVIVRQVGDETVIYYPKTRMQFTASVTKSSTYGCFISTKLCLPDDYRPGEKIVGMLGTPDDDIANEWMKPDGTFVAIPAGTDLKSGKAGYDYCTSNWCVREASKSIFTYMSGEKFSDFLKCGEKYEGTLEPCVEAPPRWATDICSADDTRCLIEACAGGEEAARNALDIEFGLTDEKGCGEVVIYEDFTENDVSSWGLIETDPRSGQTFLGRFHQHSKPVSKVFDIPDFAFFLTVEFLLYEIDDWGAVDRNRNKFYVKIGDQSFNLETFEDDDNRFGPGNFKKGYKAGITWKRQALTQATNLGFNPNYNDQIHQVTIKVPKKYFKDGKLSLQFDVSLMEDISRVSAGVDEFRITAQPRKCKATKRMNDKKDGQKAVKAKKAKKKQKVQHNSGSKKRGKRKRKRNLEDGDDRGLEAEFEDDYDDEEQVIPENGDDSSSPVECRVAYGFHSSKISTSFKEILDLSEAFLYNNDDISWGWSNGPLASSNYAYTMDMYSQGSGDRPGAVVGKMTVEYDGDEATVSIDAGERLWLKETNAYVGHSRLPMTEGGALTIDPEHYPIAHHRMSMSRTFTVADLEDEPIYVIAQTTVCGIFPTEDAHHAGVRGNADGEVRPKKLDGIVSALTGIFGNA